MKEYSQHLDFYIEYWQKHFSRMVPENIWGDNVAAEAYLKKYWLTEQEYLDVWKPIHNRIFIPGKSLPDLIYQPDFELIALKGGAIFAEEDFNRLKTAMRKVGEKHFVVIQDTQIYSHGEPMFRMKYPVDTTWDEIMSGNYISSVLLEVSMNNYFVFGESGRWGKYSATDYDWSIDIIGFNPEIGSVFQETFKQSEEEAAEHKKWLPNAYK